MDSNYKSKALKISGAVFWALFVISTISLILSAERNPRLANIPFWFQLVFSPLMIPVIWFTALYFRNQLMNFFRRFPSLPFFKFLLIGSVLAPIIVGFTVFFGLSPDLDPNPVINTLVYVGPWGGIISGWYILRHFYIFDYRHVFWISGIWGAITEQNYLMPLMLLSGDIVGAFLTTIYLIPSYAVATALMFLIMPKEQLPKGTRNPGFFGYLLFFVVPIIMFYVGAIVWYIPLGVILGRNLIFGS